MSRPVALVTGAGGGIGGASADALAAAGMEVARTDLPLDVADSAAVWDRIKKLEYAPSTDGHELTASAIEAL